MSKPYRKVEVDQSRATKRDGTTNPERTRTDDQWQVSESTRADDNDTTMYPESRISAAKCYRVTEESSHTVSSEQ